MAAPANSTPDAALDLTGLLPYQATLDVTEAPDAAQTVWYRYTASEAQLLAFYPRSDFPATTTYQPKKFYVYEGLANAQAGAWLWWHSDADFRSYTVPIDPGVTYYLEIQNTFPEVPPTNAQLSLRVSLFPAATIPDGALCIPDDHYSRARMVVLDATEGSVLAVVPFPAGEYADILPDGTILTHVALETFAAVYDRAFNLVAQVAGVNPGGSVWTRVVAVNEAFYFLASALGTLRRISPAGVVTQTWTLPADAVTTRPFAISPDETICYYGTYTTNPRRLIIRRYALNTNEQLPDLVVIADCVPAMAMSAPSTLAIESPGLPDGSLLIAVRNAGDVKEVRRYAADGTLLRIYTLDNPNLDRLARGRDDTTFWAWSFSGSVLTAPTLSAQFDEYDVATGARLTTLTGIPFFEVGVSAARNASPFDPPLGAAQPEYGISESCPLLVLRSRGPVPPAFGVPGCPTGMPMDPGSDLSGCPAGFFDPL